MINRIRRILRPASLKLRYPQFGKFLSEMETSQWWAADRIIELQNVKLLRLLEHAYHSVPFYRQRWDALGFKPGDLTRESFKQIPLLSRQDIKQNLQDLICAELQPHSIFNSTG